DLLLNHLMRMSGDADRKTIRDLWNEMLLSMGRRDISRFLRHLWVSKYGDLKSEDLFTALKGHLEAHKIESLEFTRTCSEECEKYVQLIDGSGEHLTTVAPILHSLLNKLDIQPVLPVLLSAYQTLPLADFEKVARWLLVFSVRYAVIANLDMGGLESLM